MCVWPLEIGHGCSFFLFFFFHGNCSYERSVDLKENVALRQGKAKNIQRQEMREGNGIPGQDGGCLGTFV